MSNDLLAELVELSKKPRKKGKKERKYSPNNKSFQRKMKRYIREGYSIAMMSAIFDLPIPIVKARKKQLIESNEIKRNDIVSPLTFVVGMRYQILEKKPGRVNTFKNRTRIFEYLGEVKCACQYQKMHLFNNIAGQYKESFTDQQLYDLHVKEVNKK